MLIQQDYLRSHIDSQLETATVWDGAPVTFPEPRCCLRASDPAPRSMPHLAMRVGQEFRIGMQEMKSSGSQVVVHEAQSKDLSGIMSTKALILLLALIAAGCSLPNAFREGGSLEGSVQLYDTTGNLVNVTSGVEVQIQGTTIKTTADSNGHYRLSNVPAGTFAVSFIKPGCGVYTLHQQVFIGTGTAYLRRVSLFQAPMSRVSLDSINVLRRDSAFLIKLFYRSYTGRSNPALFWGRDSVSVSSTQVSSRYEWANTRWLLAAQGFRHGDRVYIALSEYNSTNWEYEYYDPLLRITRIASTGPKSNILSFEMP
jgi:hypothetical protein